MISFHCSFCDSTHFSRFNISFEDISWGDQNSVVQHICRKGVRPLRGKIGI